MVAFLRSCCAVALAAVLISCGASPPTTPPPPPQPNPGPPPQNTAPTVESITVQGRRPRQPASFADVRETVDVRATVRDPETSIDELTYEWSATAGTFSGTGRNVTWTAPETATTPSTVTITLKVVEQYGRPGEPKDFKHEVTATHAVKLHDSAREVGDMTVRFLTEFSKPQTNKDWQDVMRDFKASACPDPREIDAERDYVINHYTNFFMHEYRVENATVSVDFGGACSYRGKAGDACAVVPIYWDSTDTRTNVRRSTKGLDHVSAAYSTADARWWLCSSQYQETGTLRGHAFYSDR